eukprot:TRINITY_DN12722_c0_g1_i2.p1 TRINITY_DN12722_c0_g1~~TRINITY_DN12722_c0_g1_i2.p1  ORF type:complete len:445 (+),score=107.55 TRINITY_DN12722_c0_g1_i2:57-1391(+)
MITPRFQVTQEANFVVVEIHAPYIKSDVAEFDISGCEFRFHAKPFFLRLRFPHPIKEDGSETATYDIDSGMMAVRLPKETPGLHFENLDLITLLAPKAPGKAKKTAAPLIEVLDSQEESIVDDGEGSAPSFNILDWEYEQQLPQNETPEDLLRRSKYGFNLQKSGVFSNLAEEQKLEICLLSQPDSMTEAERRIERLGLEDEKFDPEHYIADFALEEELSDILTYRHPWSQSAEEMEFTEVEREVMMRLPNKEFLIESEREILLGLVDILFAYCYDRRVNTGDHNVESGWTINRLSATLSCLEVFHTIQDLVPTVFRRSLCYPLYRNWRLSMCVFHDVKDLLQKGKRWILRALIDVKKIFEATGDSRYVLNQLYIDDYCIWIQSAHDTNIASLHRALEIFQMSKHLVVWPLEELEREGEQRMEEEDEDDEDDEDDEEDEEDDES